MQKFRLIFSFIVLLLVFSGEIYAGEIRVEGLKFKGNKQLSSGKLAKAIFTQANPWYRLFMPWIDSRLFDKEVFLTDLLRLEKFYQQEGYLLAKVTDYKLNFSRKKDKVKITVFVEEGEPTKVDEVTFQFKADSTRGLIPERMPRILKLKSGKRYREIDLRLDYDKIITRFSDNGYPYIEAKVRPVFDRKNKTVNLVWMLKPGPFCHFGKIIYSGNEHVSDKAIQRGLGFAQGKPFAQKKLASAQSQVYRLELFQFVSLRATELESQSVAIPIEVRVKEAKLRTLKFGLGYGTEESFRGFAQWRHRNFLGGARILRLNAKRSARLLPLEIEAELSQPYFLSNRNDLIVKPFFRWTKEESFEERSFGSELTLTRRLTGNTNAFTTTIFEQDTVTAKGGTGGSSSKSKSILRVGLTRNSSDQLFTPTRGSVTTLLLEESGHFLSTSGKYIKIYAQHRLYKRFEKKNVFAAKFTVGLMRPVSGSATTPREERFFSGGNYSVRGWSRQELGPADAGIPLGGDSLVEGSFELRRNLYKQFSGALFLDYGNVWQKWDDLALNDLHYAIGLGLRYNTLIGPIRIDLARKINKQPSDGNHPFQLHFSIGQAF